MGNTNLEYFFSQIQEGQDLAHHRTKWWAIGSKTIAFFGKIGNPKTQKKSHTSIITDVVKKGNVIEFRLLQSTVKQGVRHSAVRKIIKLVDNKYCLSGFHKDEKIYWSPDVNLGNEELAKFILFQNAVIGKKYAKLSEVKTTYIIRFVKLFTKFVKWFFRVEIEDVDISIPKLESIKGFYCSQLSARKDYEVGVIDEDDYKDNPYPDPMEFFKNKKTVLRIK